MKILLIEDDDNKIKVINEFIDNSLLDIKICIAKSYNSGLKEIFINNYDLILLDISMPVFDKINSESGGEFMKFAGVDILKEMEYRNIRCKTVIITQYDDFGNKTLIELKEELKNDYPENYFGTVYYNAAESKWKDELLNLIKNN